ncbi:hypothetical protein Droror1_Dr00011389 [Drosera rotundifolia]
MPSFKRSKFKTQIELNNPGESRSLELEVDIHSPDHRYNLTPHHYLTHFLLVSHLTRSNNEKESVLAGTLNGGRFDEVKGEIISKNLWWRMKLGAFRGDSHRAHVQFLEEASNLKP